jgi:hypothetical protein
VTEADGIAKGVAEGLVAGLVGEAEDDVVGVAVVDGEAEGEVDCQMKGCR